MKGRIEDRMLMFFESLPIVNELGQAIQSFSRSKKSRKTNSETEESSVLQTFR